MGRPVVTLLLRHVLYRCVKKAMVRRKRKKRKERFRFVLSASGGLAAGFCRHGFNFVGVVVFHGGRHHDDTS